MSGEMIERVARALCAMDGEDYAENHRRYDEYARAAIEAMREPTEAMIAAGASHITGSGALAFGTWRVMADEALK